MIIKNKQKTKKKKKSKIIKFTNAQAKEFPRILYMRIKSKKIKINDKNLFTLKSKKYRTIQKTFLFDVSEKEKRQVIGKV